METAFPSWACLSASLLTTAPSLINHSLSLVLFCRWHPQLSSSSLTLVLVHQFLSLTSPVARADTSVKARESSPSDVLLPSLETFCINRLRWWFLGCWKSYCDTSMVEQRQQIEVFSETNPTSPHKWNPQCSMNSIWWHTTALKFSKISSGGRAWMLLLTRHVTWALFTIAIKST